MREKEYHVATSTAILVDAPWADVRCVSSVDVPW